MMRSLVISFTDHGRDPRVKRQIKWLTDMGASVITVGLGPSTFSVDKHINLASPSPRSVIKKFISGFQLLLGQYQRYYWSQSVVKQLKELFENDLKESFDLILVNDFDPLPIAKKYKRGAKIVLDAHEYSPEEFSDRLIWKLLVKNYAVWLCRSFLGHVDAIISVNQEIGLKYAKVFNIPIPQVITNACPFVDLKPSEVDSERIRLIYHGVANRSRSIGCIIDLFSHLDDRFEMDMILVPGDQATIDSIKKMAKKFSKIRFLKPVPMEDIVPLTNQYDIGVFLLPPVNFNYLNALPNKLFEFIQARLAVAIGPSPAMANIVEQYRCGVTSHDFHPRSLARHLNALSFQDIYQMKLRSHEAAKVLNAEANKDIFIRCIERTLNSSIRNDAS